jgi:DinB family protein
MQDYVIDLLATIDREVPRLMALGAAASSRRPAPGKWSPREVIGHLIDSASNNHGRFVRAQLQPDLVFEGYAQDDWVRTQRYQDAEWSDLVTLWAALNRHLARVMAAAPADVREQPRVRHNLDALAWRAIPAAEPATLDYFMRDYVEHLKHHLTQIADAVSPSRT